MWEGLLNSIRQMGVFMICAQALLYFKPKGSYEKSMKLLVSAMILVQLLSPVAALLAGKGGASLEEIEAHAASLEPLLHPNPKLPHVSDPAKQPSGKTADEEAKAWVSRLFGEDK